MSISMAFPFGKADNVKNLAFTILTRESPLKIIELTNFIRKRYGRSVTFQAVRKAVLELVSEGVLMREEKEFSISKDWVRESKQIIDRLYEDLHREKTGARFDAIDRDVSVFTFSSLNLMMKFWQDFIDDWFRKFKKGDPNVNCYQSAHAWEGLLHLDRERTVMGQLKRKGIKSITVSTGNTPLDRNINRFYRGIGVDVHISPSSSGFDRGYYVATYGEWIVQSHYPAELVRALDSFFKKNNKLENLDLKELSEIVNRRAKLKLTIIKNLEMAKQINKSVLSQVE